MRVLQKNIIILHLLVDSTGYRNLFVNGVSVDDMIQNRRNQWYLERKQKETQERVERFARGRRM